MSRDPRVSRVLCNDEIVCHANRFRDLRKKLKIIVRLVCKTNFQSESIFDENHTIFVANRRSVDRKRIAEIGSRGRRSAVDDRIGRYRDDVRIPPIHARAEEEQTEKRREITRALHSPRPLCGPTAVASPAGRWSRWPASRRRAVHLGRTTSNRGPVASTAVERGKHARPRGTGQHDGVARLRQWLFGRRTCRTRRTHVSPDVVVYNARSGGASARETSGTSSPSGW